MADPVNVLLTSDRIDVLGGATKVDVDLNLGTAGKRGSYIYVGSGSPTDAGTVIPGGTPGVYDMYINLDPTNPADNLFLYQYINQDGEFQWVKLLRLVPNTYVTSHTGVFIDGAMTINIAVADVIPLNTTGYYNENNFNIQHTVISDSPIASAVSIGTIGLSESTGELSLPVTIKAAKFNGTAWAAMSGAAIIHLLVTVG